MKILYVTTVAGTMGFFRRLIRKLIDEGNIVDIATNEDGGPVPECYRDWGCKVFRISTSRSPLNRGNIAAIKQIRKIAAEYDIVHCHTPLAAAATRLACKKLRHNGLKVVYTAHGFHFYKGAPLKNWLIYYPIEKICARYTDLLITITTEDFELAKSKMKAKRVVYIPGIGIDLDKFFNTNVDAELKKESIGVPKDAKLLLSVGELNQNKNHQIVIKALSELKDENIHYAIAGAGGLNQALTDLAEQLGVGSQVHLLGFRTDVAELYKSCDIFLLPSIREGLSVSIMEALACGCPCIVTDTRGNTDMVDNSKGRLCNAFSVSEWSSAITSLLNEKIDSKKCIEASLIFDYRKIDEEMKGFYRDLQK